MKMEECYFYLRSGELNDDSQSSIVKMSGAVSMPVELANALCSMLNTLMDSTPYYFTFDYKGRI